MTDDLFDTRQIPDLPSYWDGLAAQVSGVLIAHPRGIAVLGASWWCVPAASAALAAALVIGFVALRGNAAASAGAQAWASAFAGNDALAQRIFVASAPPSIPELLDRAASGMPEPDGRR